MTIRPSNIPHAAIPASTVVPGTGQRLSLCLRRGVLLTAANVTPTLAANRLALRYLSPQQAVLDRLATLAHPFEVCPLGQETTLLRLPAGDPLSTAPRVLIAPGHDGNPRHFARLVRALHKRGAAVDLLILPGHAHARRSLCSLRHIVEALCIAGRHAGSYDALLAHCVSTNATMYALRHGLQCARIAMVSAPFDLPELVRSGGRQYGLTGRCLDRFTARVDHLGGSYRLDTPWQQIATTRRESLLIAHARNDWAAPIEHIRPLATFWPNAELAEFETGGHNGVLNVTSAIRRLALFLAPD
jgi:hypothetical protein